MKNKKLFYMTIHGVGSPGGFPCPTFIFSSGGKNSNHGYFRFLPPEGGRSPPGRNYRKFGKFWTTNLIKCIEI